MVLRGIMGFGRKPRGVLFEAADGTLRGFF